MMPEAEKMENRIAAIGSLILATAGEYSDFYVKGLFRVKKSFNPYNELIFYRESNPDDESYFNDDKFIAYLLNRDLIEIEKYGELYLGAYYERSKFYFHANA